MLQRKKKNSSDTNKKLLRSHKKCELECLMLVVKECCSNKEVCGKVEFLLSNWDVSSIAGRGWPLVELIWMPLIAKTKKTTSLQE